MPRSKVVPVCRFLLMESLMRVIIKVHATGWHLMCLATTASTQPSFHAAMKSVSVRGKLSMRRECFLLSVAHHLPLHHPPPPKKRMLSHALLKYLLRPIYQTLTIVSIFIFYPFSPPGALSRHLPHHHLPIRLRQHLPHHHRRSTQANSRQKSRR